MNSPPNSRSYLFFLAITFAITWLLWLPALLESQTAIQIPKPIPLVLMALGIFTPSAVGVAFVVKEGQKGVLGRWFNVRLGWYWVPIVLAIPLAGFCAQLLRGFFNGEFPVEAPSLYLLPAQFAVAMLLGPVNEEFGWRGYALPQLQKRFGAVAASLIIGTIWVFWHLPLFFIADAPQAKLPFLPFATTLILASIVITWAQNNTRQSMWPALMIHAGIGFTNELFPLFDPRSGSYVAWNWANLVLAAMVVGLISLFGAKTLSGQLPQVLKPTTPE